jgi:hypothetical protein
MLAVRRMQGTARHTSFLSLALAVIQAASVRGARIEGARLRSVGLQQALAPQERHASVTRLIFRFLMCLSGA